MNKIQQKSPSNKLLFVIITIFMLFRAYILLPEGKTGLCGRPFSITVTSESITLFSCLLVFFVLISAIITKLVSDCGERITFLAAVFICENTFFFTQLSIMKLLLSIVGLNLILLALYIKDIKIISAILPIYTGLCVFVMPSAFYSFLPMVLFLYFVVVEKNSQLDKSASRTIIISTVAAISLWLIRIFLDPSKIDLTQTNNVFFFDMIGRFKALCTSSELYSMDRVIVIFAMAVPYILFTIFYFIKYSEIGNNFEKKSSKKKEKKTDNKKKSSMKYKHLILFIISCVVNLIGLILDETYLISVMGIMAPMAIMAMVASGNKVAIKVVDDMNSFIKNNIGLFIVLLTAYVILSYFLIGKFFLTTNIIDYAAPSI